MPVTITHLPRTLSPYGTCLALLVMFQQPAIASDPLISQNGGTLIIEGDDYANSVSIVGSKLEDDTVGVYVTDVPWVYENVTHIEITMAGGDDTVVMDRIRVAGHVHVNGGAGSNFINIGGWGYGQNDIGGAIVITTGSGNDEIGMSYVTASSNVSIETGGGSDVVKFGFPAGPGIDPGVNDFAANLEVLTESGSDQVHMLATVCSGQTDIITADGNDEVRLGPDGLLKKEDNGRLQASNDLKANDGRNSVDSFKTTSRGDDDDSHESPDDLKAPEGPDEHVLPVNVLQFLFIDTGADDDYVGLELTAVTGETEMRLRGGTDELRLTANNSFFGDFLAHGGLGSDTLFDAVSNFYSNAPTFQSF